MWIVGHGQVGWLLAKVARLERRDRTLVTWCGILPDLDALTLLGGQDAYLRGHHVYLHNFLTAALLGVGAGALSRRRWLTALLGLGAALLHFASDGFGYLELRPLWPFSRLVWWPNGGRHWVAGIGEIVVPTVLLGIGVAIFARWRISPFEAISPRIDGAIVGKLRARGARLAMSEREGHPEDAKAPTGPLHTVLLEFAAALALVAVLGLIARAALEILDRPDLRLAVVAAVSGYVVVRWILAPLAKLVLDRLARRFARESGTGP